MAINDFGDITSIVEWWHAGDVTTTGSIVDTMVGQLAVVDMVNPNTFQSDPGFVTNIGPLNVDGVDFSFDGRSQLYGDTGLDDDTYSFVQILRLNDDTISTGTTLASPGIIAQIEAGLWEIKYRFDSPLDFMDGPTMATGDIVTIIFVRNDVTGDTGIYWEGTIPSGSAEENNTANFQAGQWQVGREGEFSQFTLLALAVFNSTLDSTERADLFTYSDDTYVGSRAASADSNTLFFGANF